MLRPNGDWHWLYDEQKQRLTIELGDDMLFVTHYSAKMLSADATGAQGFSLQDMEFYLKLQQCLEEAGLELSAAAMTQIALNATAVNRFYRPIMPKSWLLNRGEAEVHFSPVVQLETKQGSALALVTEHCSDSATCMLLGNQLELNNGKVLNTFDVIKVMHDCLRAYTPAQAPMQKRA